IPRTTTGGPYLSGDGGVVMVDDISRAAAGQSVRYASSNVLFGLQRAIYDAGNNVVDITAVGLANLPTNATNYYRTPVTVALNAVDPTRMVAGTTNPNAVWESLDQGDDFTQVGTVAGP